MSSSLTGVALAVSGLQSKFSSVAERMRTLWRHGVGGSIPLTCTNHKRLATMADDAELQTRIASSIRFSFSVEIVAGRSFDLT